MKLDKAISTLEEFNKWRRGAYIKMPDPKTIGLAINVVVLSHKEEQVDNKIEKRWDALK